MRVSWSSSYGNCSGKVGTQVQFESNNHSRECGLQSETYKWLNVQIHLYSQNLEVEGQLKSRLLRLKCSLQKTTLVHLWSLLRTGEEISKKLSSLLRIERHLRVTHG